MKLYDVSPESARVPLGPVSMMAESPTGTWSVAIAADEPTLMVLYKDAHWETPSVLQAWSYDRPKHAVDAFTALKRLFRDLNERTPVETLVRRLPRPRFPRRDAA